MRTPFFSSLTSSVATCIVLIAINLFLAFGQCLVNQKTILLQLKNNLVFDSTNSYKLVKWNESSDCCDWEGVSCENGRVTGLNLSLESISGGIDNSSSLFNLQHLKNLDLSFNYLNSTIPPRIGNLTNLRYLNLSYSGFLGQIPNEMSHLTRLLTLNLSNFHIIYVRSKALKITNLSILIRNLTQLQELYLDEVDISSSASNWSQVLSSSLPKLRILSLISCGLDGPIDHSLVKLKSLSVLRLDKNYFSTPFPNFVGNFTSLTSLSLQGCNLLGAFPIEILKSPILQNLDISFNPTLEVSLPEFPENNGLRLLDLSFTNFSGVLPKALSLCKNLIELHLSNNGLSGSLSSIYWGNLLNLRVIESLNNLHTGSIPSSLLKLPSLQEVRLFQNKFSGKLLEFPNASTSMLRILDLSDNNLEGPLPLSIFKLRKLEVLDLSNNNFSGTIHLHMFSGFSSLMILGFSHNSLFVNASSHNHIWPSFPHLTSLSLASCNLRQFPNLENQAHLTELDLSDNQIHRSIPSWIWEIGNLQYLNISHNYLVGYLPSYIPPRWENTALDLSFNQLQGHIPFLSTLGFDKYIDLSSNNFSSVPVNFGKYLSGVNFLSLSNNSLIGVIPESICNGSSLEFLDLSSNHLSEDIPKCMISKMSSTLQVLNLRQNKLRGHIPNAFPVDCYLHSLHLNGNSIQGQVPQSLINCKALEVLDVGNNQMADTFPCFSNNISSLRVLVLRSNNFHGSIECPNITATQPTLQIVDLAHNNFEGRLVGRLLTKWSAMMADGIFDKQNDSIGHRVTSFTSKYYQDVVMVVHKGILIELVKILKVYTSIDLSSNNFYGTIPEELGRLQALHFLNLSHNALTGSMPSSLGKLHQLESFDLSWNHLKGKIPTQLANLNFLSVLNLSYNQFVGKIPTSTQLQSFSNYSFLGNKGLCGPPLMVDCNIKPDHPTDKVESRTDVNWDIIAAEIGFVFGFGIINGPLVFSRRWRTWYFERLEDITYHIIPLCVLRKWWSWKTRSRLSRQRRGQVGRRRQLR